MLAKFGSKKMNIYTPVVRQFETWPQATSKKPPYLKSMVFGISLFTAGTGGMLTAHGLENLGGQIYEPRLHIESPIVNKVDMRSPAEQVAFIREIFALNMSDLAIVLNVTRPTIYAWLDGQEPKPEMLNQIRQISQVADRLQSLNMPRTDTLVRRPIFDGRSLLDKLKAGEDISDYLPILKNLANKEEQARNLSKGSYKNTRSFSDATSEYSTPLYNKNNKS